MDKSKTHIIDATGKPLGRLASQIALLLRGKQRADFVPYRSGNDVVIVKNASKLILTGKKIEQKEYFSHSGYPRGERHIAFKKLAGLRPTEVLRRAVRGMLPHNRLNAQIIKRLKFE